MDPRVRMVAEQIRARGVRDERVLDALLRVPRETFVPERLRADAHADHPVTIGYGQTISQPYIVAYMTEALRIEPGDRILEIGTGCGYQTAVLAELAAEVFSVEVIPDLAEQARRSLDALGYTNIHIRTGDGYEGWPEHAPYDGILGAAAADAIPPALIEQLAEDAILVMPVGSFHQDLRVIQKRKGRIEVLATLPVRFVPMVKTR